VVAAGRLLKGAEDGCPAEVSRIHAGLENRLVKIRARCHDDAKFDVVFGTLDPWGLTGLAFVRVGAIRLSSSASTADPVADGRFGR
jgi:hypothetical protein